MSSLDGPLASPLDKPLDKPFDKAAWRARLRAQRRDMQVSPPSDSAAGLARAGIGWLTTLREPVNPRNSGGAQAKSGAGFDTDGGAGTPRCVCAYISMGNEPPTGQLLDALAAAGHIVYVPVCEPNFQLTWTRWSPGAQMAPSLLAPVMEPMGVRLPFAQLGAVRAIFVPALAVDASGVRLGQGGGYYDRFLANVTAVPLAAVIYAHEFLSAGSLPRAPLDVPVAYAITPAGHQIMAR